MLVVLCMYWSANDLSLATATVTVLLLKLMSLSGATVNKYGIRPGPLAPMAITMGFDSL